MGSTVRASIIAVCLFASTLPAQEKKVAPEMEAFADKLIAAPSESDQIVLLEENKPVFNPDLVELLHQRGTLYYNKRDFTNL